MVVGQTLTGRFSTSVYTWENQFADETATKSFQGAQTLILNSNNVGMKDLSFYTFVRGTYDLGATSSNNPDYRVYSFYGQWHHHTPTQRFSTKIGRQTVFTGLRSPTVDAVEADYGYKDYFTAMGYFGALPPDNGQAAILKPFLRRSFGGKISTSRVFETNLAVTYYEKSREGNFYSVPSVYHGDSIIARPDMQERLLAFDASRAVIANLTTYEQVQFDLLEKQLQKFTSDWRYEISDKASFAATYTFRRPSILYNSIFSAFDDLQSNQEIWLRANYRYDAMWSFYGDYANVFYDLKDAWRWSLGVTYWRTGLSYSRRDGYGGTVNSISASAYYPVTPHIGANASLTYSSFNFKGDQIGSSDVVDFISKQVLKNSNQSFEALAAIRYDFNRMLNVDVETQYLSQNIKSSPVFGGYKSDFRVFIRANYWFYSHM